MNITPHYNVNYRCPRCGKYLIQIKVENRIESLRCKTHGEITLD